MSVGLDLSPEAIAAAKAEQQQQLADNPTASAAAHLVAGDFFKHSSSPEFKGPFDVGYDYTFLCALHPGELLWTHMRLAPEQQYQEGLFAKG